MRATLAALKRRAPWPITGASTYQQSPFRRMLMSSRALSRFVNSALAALACTLVSGMSQAARVDSDMGSVKVTSAGLDLSTDSGALGMFKRLTGAAEQACGGAAARFDALHAPHFRLCYKETLSNAIRTLNQPMVTHAYVAQYPQDAARYGIAAGNYVAGR
jgi:UrcA family protein